MFLIDHLKITFIVYSFMLIVFFKSSGSIDSGSNRNINTSSSEMRSRKSCSANKDQLVNRGSVLLNLNWNVGIDRLSQKICVGAELIVIPIPE